MPRVLTDLIEELVQISNTHGGDCEVEVDEDGDLRIDPTLADVLVLINSFYADYEETEESTDADES